jgi:trans-aconitate methyltransferase
MGEAGSSRQFGRVFDDVAAEYDAARPSYPLVLVDRAVKARALDRHSTVLELGCGTGKLTELLVGRGLRVHAVEPGANLVEEARRRLGPTDSVHFEIARFEDAELPEQAYDGVFSATAFHWLEPAVSWAKVASLLKPGGLLALLTHIGVHDERSSEMEGQLLASLQSHAPEIAADWSLLPALDNVVAGARERSANASEVWNWVMNEGRHALAVPEAAALFDDVAVTAVLSRDEQTADEMLAHLRTTSLYFMLAPERRGALVDDYRRLIERAGTYPSSRATVLMTARRVAAPARA